MDKQEETKKDERLALLNEIVEDMERHIYAHHSCIPMSLIQNMSISELVAYTHPLNRNSYIEKIKGTNTIDVKQLKKGKA